MLGVCGDPKIQQEQNSDMAKTPVGVCAVALGDIFWPASEEEQYPGVGILYQKGPETLGQSSIPREFLLYLWKIPGSNIDSVSPTTPPGQSEPL